MENGGISYYPSNRQALNSGHWIDPPTTVTGNLEKGTLTATAKRSYWVPIGQGALNGGSVSLLGPSREPYDGVLGFLEYGLTGGNENGIHYDRDGNPNGLAPIAGEAPDVGRGNGLKALKLLIREKGVWKWAINGRTASAETLKKFGLSNPSLSTSSKLSKVEQALENTISGVPNSTTPLSTWEKVKQMIRIVGQLPF